VPTFIKFYCSSRFGKKPVITTKEEDIEAFKECTKSALVVSEVFCLPSDYRKDVPPPSKFFTIFIISEPW
jgi:hypothetical protein